MAASYFSGAAAAQRQAWVSFRAGKVAIEERGPNRYRCTPEAAARKGLVELMRGDDGLVHCTWRDRSTDRVEDDILVFPDEVEFRRVRTGTESDRVYVLQFKNSARRFMFWMQEMTDENDEEYCRKMNNYMNNPPNPQQQGGLGGAGGPGGAANPFAQLMGGGGAGGMPGMPGMPGAAQGGPTAAGGGGGNVSRSQLQDIFSSMGFTAEPAAGAGADASGAIGGTGGASADGPSNAAGASTSAAASGQLTAEDLQRAMMGIVGATQGTPSLQNVADVDRAIREGILDDEEVVNALVPLLPEGQQDREHLEPALRSAQFRQALGSLSAALQTDNFNTVMANFQLDPSDGAEAMARGDGVGAFIDALQAAADRAGASASSSASSSSGSDTGGAMEEEKTGDADGDGSGDTA